jgi:hypothetical protein
MTREQSAVAVIKMHKKRPLCLAAADDMKFLGSWQVPEPLAAG